MGIGTSIASKRSCKETDLIYEGIATTEMGHFIVPINFPKETDLIYEGIATTWPHMSHSSRGSKETDLIYEGIAT